MSNDKRITGVPEKMNFELRNIAANLNMTRTFFIKKELAKKLELIDLSKIKNASGSSTIVKITGFNRQTEMKIQAICAETGCDFSAVTKFLLNEIVKCYPDHMKKPPLDY